MNQLAQGFLILAIATLCACSPHRQVMSSGDKGLAKEIAKLDDLSDHQWGMALYDPEMGKWLYQKDADQYFTPASNTKILTYAAASHYLGDSTIALKYTYQNDTLIFRGTGDPSLLFIGDSKNYAIELLRHHDGPIMMKVDEQPQKYGPGWAWDDYGYSYQVERSLLPIFGNRLTYKQDAVELPPSIQPLFYAEYLVEDFENERLLTRIPEANAFSINPDKIRTYPVEVSVPFIISDYDVAGIVSNVIGKEVKLDYGDDVTEDYLQKAGVPTDSLYIPLMQDSDNFIAEQLLLQIASSRDWPMDYDLILDSLRDFSFMANGESPDEFYWFDGSGLSRYNLFTPRSLVWILDGLLKSQGSDRLFNIFPAGGESGTIESWYAGETNPYVFAKTGTLRNKHALSGFLRTSKGRILVFSFMHNNYSGPSATVKDEMEVALKYIFEKY